MTNLEFSKKCIKSLLFRTPYLVTVCLARWSTDLILLSICWRVRNAARFAVYAAVITRVQNQKKATIVLIDVVSGEYSVLPRRNIYYLKFAWGHFYDVMSALLSKTYFQITGKLMLEINSKMLSKSLIIFPFSTFGKPVHLRVTIEFWGNFRKL